MKVLFYTFFTSVCLSFYGQGFIEKYAVSEFMSQPHSEKKLKMFKEFKQHLKEQGYRFDHQFRREYEAELHNHPLAFHIFKKYRRKTISAYTINGASGLLMGAGLSIFDQFFAGFIGGVVGTQIYTLPLHLLAKINFIESLLIYYSDIEKNVTT
tara:strand:+ start:89 stop:550 length:462 start_codon:yes stop_codon:yes gene_type:complete